MKNLKTAADRVRVGEPVCEDETDPEFNSITGWLNNTSAELTDAAALASVTVRNTIH